MLSKDDAREEGVEEEDLRTGLLVDLCDEVVGSEVVQSLD
jgi:hypothetical protein